MFNEDIEAAISMWQDKNHIELLLAIEKSVFVPEGYNEFLIKSIQKQVRDYLDTYGYTEEMN